MTLIEQWNQYDAIIKNREAEYLKEIVAKFFSGEVPKFLYEVWGFQGKIIELEITGFRYSNGKYFSYNKRPTKQMVNEIRLFAESNHEFSTDNVYLGYKKNHTTFTTSGALKFKEIPNYLISKESAEEKAKPLAEKYAFDEKLVSSGTHIRCQRCSKVVANADVVNYNIVSFATYGRGGRNMKFCSGTCAGNEQMAHEG